MKTTLIKIDSIIHQIRGHRVMLDYDLAALYEVKNRALKQAVRRNIDRFPPDFMFELTKDETAIWRSQSVIPNLKMSLRIPPMCFTQEGVAMLSGILRSSRAVEMNISIMRAFVRMRQYIMDTRELADRFRELERKLESHDKDIASILDAMRQLMAPPPASSKKIGFQHIK